MDYVNFNVKQDVWFVECMYELLFNNCSSKHEFWFVMSLKNKVNFFQLDKTMRKFFVKLFKNQFFCCCLGEAKWCALIIIITLGIWSNTVYNSSNNL